MVGSAGEFGETIWVIDSTGSATGVAYNWASADYSSSGVAAWVNDDWDPVDVTIKEGEGFYISTDASNISLQVAGSVKLTDYVIPLNSGYTLSGNCTPVAINIQDIKVVGSDGEFSETIWVIDATGSATGVAYNWASEEYSSSGVAAWVNDDWDPVDVTLAAGEGLYISSENVGVSLKIAPAIK